MAYTSSLKQILSLNVKNQVQLMEWSNKMDLIAASNEKNWLMVNRLKWKSIWVHTNPDESATIQGIAWRPDEKVIAVAYSSGLISLLNVENKEELHAIKVDSPIASVCWAQNTDEIAADDSEDELFLTKLPSLNLSSRNQKVDHMTRSYSKNVLNFLVVTLETGDVQLFAFGILRNGFINVKSCLPEELIGEKEVKVLSSKLSPKFDKLFVQILIDQSLHLVVLETEFLPKYAHSLLQLSARHCQILDTMSYINDVIQNITEAWETVLLEMDNKLTKYSESSKPGSVSADFLELLVFGKATPELENFLRRDLTEKGLKKLGNCIELCYSTIQMLVVHPLQTAIMNVCVHLTKILGMSRDRYYFKDLLDNRVQEAIQKAGSFMIKAFELQQTIDQSTRDYKIFFRWLYVVIMRLMEETVPDEISQMTQQDLNYLAEFLSVLDDEDEPFEESAFTPPGEQKKRKFNLEKVGQYLEDAPLRFNPHSKTEWEELLEENQCFKTSNVIYKRNPNASLVQEFKSLQSSIESVFQRHESIVSSSFKLHSIIKCGGEIKEIPLIRSLSTEKSKETLNLFLFLLDSTSFAFIEFQDTSPRFLKVQFQSKLFFDSRFQAGEFNFQDIQFYNDETLSMLLKFSKPDQTHEVYFLQFPVNNLRTKLRSTSPASTYNPFQENANTVNFYQLIDANSLKLIEGSNWKSLAVSGNRKVCTLLSDSGRKVRVYETEVEDDDEEDEDEDEDMENLSHDLDTSI